MNKSFKIKQLFTVINNPQLDKENFVFSEDANYPYFTRTENNNGILGYVEYLDDEHKIKGNSLAVGMISMKFHYMAHDFYAGQFTKTLIPTFDGFDEAIALFFIGILNKHSSYYQSYLVREFVSRVNNTICDIPVIENPNPGHEYTVDDIDWQYIRDYITELECDRIKELATYLQATGLNDYELTEEDKKVLSEEKIFSDFDIVKVFTVKNTKCIMQSQIVPNSGIIPYVTASNENNAISSYIDCSSEWIDEGNCVFIGGKTLVITYQEKDFCSNDSHNLALYLNDDSHRTHYVYKYMVGALKSALSHKYYWGDSISRKKIQTDKMLLPITSDREPDYNYMEKYIRAMEKVVIANVVKYFLLSEIFCLCWVIFIIFSNQQHFFSKQ